MNTAHLHLISSHVSVLGPLFGSCLLAVGLLRRSQEIGKLSLWVFVLSAFSAASTYLCGEAAGELLVRLVTGISADATDQHAEVAVLALAISVPLGLVSFAGIIAFRKSKRMPMWFATLTLLLSLLSSGMMAWTANLGGRIRHTEIQSQGGEPRSVHR
ncbi:MAG: hypothetical protein HY735_08640 [Verrucomicrobia bacterium]|nr:hypothetical protein [Verrucomicrobiota bacterium]